MKLKTAELTGPALDWAVAKCEGVGLAPSALRYMHEHKMSGEFMYSTDWSQGGPIIEREGIMLRAIRSEGHALHGIWLAMPANRNTDSMVQWVRFFFKDQTKRGYWEGPTALVAAMRCFVASKLGNEVDVPDELV